MTGPLGRQILLAGSTGLLYPLCFPDFDLGPLAWFVLVPLHVAVEGTTMRRAFRLGWLSGTIAFLTTMSWVVTAMHLYGKMPLLVSYVVLVLLAGYLGLYVALYGMTLAWLRRTIPGLALFAAPFIWVALELLRTYLLSGLPWALLGYSQYHWLPAIQIADLTGVYGVSFLIVLANAALTDVGLWILRRTKSGRFLLPRQRDIYPWAVGGFPRLAPTAALLGLALALAYGEVRLGQAGQARGLSSDTSGAPLARTIQVGIVQPNIDQAQKWDRAFVRETIDRYTRLTGRVARGSDLVIWPEAATPFLFEQEQDYRNEITSLVKAHGVPLLFGSPALRYFDDGRPYLLNSAYLFSAGGQILGRYDKRHLVPFGEYIPLRSVLFFLDKLVEGIGDFEAGTVPTVLALPKRSDSVRVSPGILAKFGVVICFEVIFPDLVRDFVREGAEFMVTITNDAWFGKSAAPFQHFGMVVFRAVENRIAFARSANTGISGLIAPDGRILSATSIFTEQTVTGQIPIRNAPTFYTYYGDLFAYGCVIITGIFLLFGVMMSRRGLMGTGL